MRNNLVESLIEQLQSLPVGTETTSFDVLVSVLGKDCYDEQFLFKMDMQLRKAAEKAGLFLDDSAYAGLTVGLPYNIPFIVRHTEK